VENAKKCPAIAWVFVWAICSSFALVLAKKLDPVINNFLVVFIRSLFGLFIISPFVIKEGLSSLKIKGSFFHISRILCGFSSMVCTYYAYRNLPLAFATSLGFTGPIFASVLSMIFLGSKITRQKWIAICIGYVGVLIMVRPTTASFGVAAIALLFSNLFAGFAVVSLKKLTRVENNRTTLMFYGTFGIACASGIMSFMNFVIPSNIDLLYLMGIGLFMTLGQFCYLSALQCADPVFLAPFEYSKIIISIPVGVFMFGEHLKIWSLIGSIVIIFSNYLITTADKKPHEIIEEQQ
jgi:drug/metabolite transporter (DMT)-like permease